MDQAASKGSDNEAVPVGQGEQNSTSDSYLAQDHALLADHAALYQSFENSKPSTQTGYAQIHPSGTSSGQQTPAPADYIAPGGNDQIGPIPQPLNYSARATFGRLVFDCLVAAIAILFVIFGFYVHKYDQTPAIPGSMGRKLADISIYGPTVFPALFAAIVGGSMKSLASWYIQSEHGATVGLVEQCMGSSSISGAFTTQLKLYAFNALGLFIILLWCLSPLGSQASLRVISIVPSYPSSMAQLTSLASFSEFQFDGANSVLDAKLILVYPVASAMTSAQLLGSRNQDLWGNIRVPRIEQLESNGDENGWFDVTQISNLTFPSLVGLPVSGLASVGNTSFTLSASYTAVSCSVLEPTNQTGYTDFSAPNAISPGNGYDCSWVNATSSSDRFQLAVSIPCGATLTETPAANSLSNGTRNARVLLWELWRPGSGFNTMRTECQLTTTYVDVNITCSGGATSTSSSCIQSHARRSPTPQFGTNWTVLDLNDELSASAFVQLMTSLYPMPLNEGMQDPVLVYFIDPYQILGVEADTNSDDLLSVSRPVFEARLEQLLNSVLYVGTNTDGLTGSFNASNVQVPLGDQLVNFSAIVTTELDIVQCNLAWLGVLSVASLVAFAVAIVGAVLRAKTLTPDLLGSVTLAMLYNKLEGVPASSTWDSTTRTRHLRKMNLFLGDVEPEADVGRIGLVNSSYNGPAGPVKRGRYYY